MSNDFDKERKIKLRIGSEMAKCAKKYHESKHLEEQKLKRRFEIELKKRNTMMTRMVQNYWKKIGKVVNHGYLKVFEENKANYQQQQLIVFINRLKSISAKVAESLQVPN